jgi:hypothetical protein
MIAKFPIRMLLIRLELQKAALRGLLQRGKLFRCGTHVVQIRKKEVLQVRFARRRWHARTSRLSVCLPCSP